MCSFPGTDPTEPGRNGKEYLKAQNLEEKMDKATHIAWATGGSLVPEEIREEYKNTYLDK